MSCQTCGRTEEDGGGHWLGCEAIGGTPAPEPREVAEGGGETREQCEIEGCENMKASASPRAKYCADHKDPKNRKE